MGTLILSGCGTIANFSGKGWDNTHIYGGVVRNVKSAEEWIEAKPITKDTELQQGIGTVVGTGLIVLDVPLSAIGDTLTLPITIPAAIWGTPSAHSERQPQRGRQFIQREASCSGAGWYTAEVTEYV